MSGCQDIDFKKTLTKWNGNGNAHGNAYDRGDYNSSFALRAVELKSANISVIVHTVNMVKVAVGSGQISATISAYYTLITII